MVKLATPGTFVDWLGLLGRLVLRLPLLLPGPPLELMPLELVCWFLPDCGLIDAWARLSRGTLPPPDEPLVEVIVCLLL